MIKYKKCLLLLSACFLTSTFVYAADVAETGPEVKLDGLFNFESGFRNQGKLQGTDKNLTNHNNAVAFFSEANVSATATKVVNDMTYGAKVILMTTTRPTTFGGFNGSHLFVESEYGKVELGSPYSAASKMIVTGSSIDAATGGDWSGYAKLDGSEVQHNGLAPEFADASNFFLDSTHKMSLNQHNDKTEPARKVSYFTPEMHGFRAGISYIPDSSNVGLAAHNRLAGGCSRVVVAKTPNDATSTLFEIDQNVKNAIAGGISYKHHVSDAVDIALAATGEYGKSSGQIIESTFAPAFAGDSGENATKTEIAKRKLSDLRTYNLGAVLTYGNFSYGASYGNLGNSLTNSEYHKAGRGTKYYNGSIAYGQGAVKTSLSYFKSEHFKNNLDSVTLSTQYKLAPGLLPYAEVSYFQTKGRPVFYPDAQKKKSKGTVAIVGAMLKF